MLLADLPNGVLATVNLLRSGAADIDAATLRRLAELGFLPGEPVRVMHRGPGGREPLAVLVGDTLFALRRVEAACVDVTPA
ncbi:MAG: transport protein A [Burkholderiales bacterium PBB6]|jgi:ferrous iron transport protein A|uniref:FeoA family protein n=1 Tax=Ideonella margarita TaxID=2984191 RepID=A0ABU9C8Y5_9BURK|nr:MAG: transport protein A [Burkholderiales bacterium PBB6]